MTAKNSSLEVRAREFVALLHGKPPQMVDRRAQEAHLLALLTAVASEAVAGERERCVTVVRDHLAKAATIRQAVAQPGMDPELSPERKQEEHRIASATIALIHPLTKSLRSSPSGGEVKS